MGVVPTSALKRSLKAERDMAASLASVCTVQAWPGARCTQPMARATPGSDSPRNQPVPLVVVVVVMVARCSRRMLTSSSSPMRPADRRQPGRRSSVSLVRASMVSASPLASGNCCARIWMSGGRMVNTECRQ